MIHDARKIKLHNDVVRNDTVHCPEYKINIWRLSLYKSFKKNKFSSWFISNKRVYNFT